MDDAHDPYEATIDSMRENIHDKKIEAESNGRRNQVTPLDIATSTRIIRVELQSCRADNERLTITQEE